MTSLTRGPLPASVYWRRRLAVLSVALVLVLGTGRVLDGGSDASDPDRATPVAARHSALPTPGASPTEDGATAVPVAPPAGTGESRGNGKGKGQQEPGQATSTEPVLAAPQGRCESSDVAVTPEVTEAVAGRDVEVVLNLRTVVSPACTWRVSPANVTLKITSGRDGIWSTRECPRALPREDVVVRNNVTTSVGVTWRDAARMDEGCTRITEWALPGYYHATVAALGGEPSDVQFELEAPKAAKSTPTGKPRRR